MCNAICYIAGGIVGGIGGRPGVPGIGGIPAGIAGAKSPWSSGICPAGVHCSMPCCQAIVCSLIWLFCFNCLQTL